MRVRHHSGYGELLDAGDGHPVVRYELPDDPAVTGLSYGRAVAFVRPSRIRGLVITVVGPAGEVRRLLASPELADLAFAGGQLHTGQRPRAMISVPAENLADLQEHFMVRDGGDWEWMWTTGEPAAQDREPVVSDLPASTQDELNRFLQEHNPRTDGRPFAHPDQVWLGARAIDGSLLGCGCLEPNDAGIGSLAGITTDPRVRGRGYGAAITAALTRRSLTATGACVLGMYSDNTRARALYHRLGFRTAAAFNSRVVFPRGD